MSINFIHSIIIYLCLRISFCNFLAENSLDASVDIDLSLQSGNREKETYSVVTFLPPISSWSRQNENRSQAHEAPKSNHEVLDESELLIETHVAAKVPEPLKLKTHVITKAPEPLKLEAHVITEAPVEPLNLEAQVTTKAPESLKLETHVITEASETLNLEAHVTTKAPESLELEVHVITEAPESLNLEAHVTTKEPEPLKLETHVITKGPEPLKLETHVITEAPEPLNLEAHVTTKAPESLELETHVITEAPESLNLEAHVTTKEPEPLKLETHVITEIPESLNLKANEKTKAPESLNLQQTHDIIEAPESLLGQVETEASNLNFEEPESSHVAPETNESPELVQEVNDVTTLPDLNYEEYELLNTSSLPLLEGSDEPFQYYDTLSDVANAAIVNYCNYVDHNVSAVITVRKCCQEKEFFNSETGECEAITDSEKIKDEIRKFSQIPNDSVVNTFSKTLDECQPRRVVDLSLDPSYGVIGTGHIYDCSLDLEYNIAEYCLEMSGSDLGTAVLWLVYCPRSVVVPKCCPEGHFFDKNSYNCTPYFYTDDGEGDGDYLLHPYLSQDFELGFSDLRCDLHLPEEINMNQAALRGSTLCLTNYDQCYAWDQYCIENMGHEGGSELLQAALVCPKVLIDKCCPDGLLLHHGKCVEFGQQSPQLTHILKTNMYKVESVANRRVHCDPIMVENDTNLEIFWSVDSEGNAAISYHNSVVQTTKIFCVDDFVNSAMDVTPALRVCTEDFPSEIISGKVMQKCCPEGMVFYAEATEESDRCVPKTNFDGNILEVDALRQLNISHFQIHEFPENCSNLFSYDFGHSHSDGNHVELINATSLRIANNHNNCTTQETYFVDPSTFCIDFRVQNGSYRPVALVCNYGHSSTYAEKKYIIVCLTALSCGALVVSLVMLACTRVRRGMFTVRKSNTLAGKILISYVFSQLVGYGILGFITFWSFSEENNLCFTLSGILQFSMIAAFCWNTTICLEGLLLTMDVRTSERRRYVYHSLWAWGIPGVITAITLTIDTHRDSFSCDAITPKIGVDRCFFSDFRAQLLYLYLPISVFVLLNAIFLLSGKALRQTQLKKLEEGHANFRAKNSGTVPSTHSGGLRTHQTKNLWIESLKLVIWSGITWLLEMVGTAVTIRGGGSEGEWFNYLWYIPMGANCLRGLGIFFILAVTPEQQNKLSRLARYFSEGFSRSVSKFRTNERSTTKAAPTKDTESSVTGEGFNSTSIAMYSKESNAADSDDDDELKDRKAAVATTLSNISDDRKASVSTIVSNISDSTRKGSVSTIVSNFSDFPDFQNDTATNSSTPPPMYRSISHYAPSRQYKAALPDVSEDSECENKAKPSWIDPETSSLDNTATEAMFLELNGYPLSNEQTEKDLNEYPEVNLNSDTITDKVLPKINLADSIEVKFDQLDKVRKRKSVSETSLDSESDHTRSTSSVEDDMTYLQEIQTKEDEDKSFIHLNSSTDV